MAPPGFLMKSILKHGLKTPDLPKHLTQPDTFSLESEEYYSQLLLANLDATEAQASHVTFEQVSFRQVTFTGSRLVSSRLSDCRLERCDLSIADWEKLRLKRIEFLGCRLIGAKLIELNAEDVLFKECGAEHANFALAAFKSVRFEKCDLRQASFISADLSGVVFHDCDLSNADFSAAHLTGTDFRTSLINGIRVGVKELRGAIIAPIQAVQVVTLLGLTVQEFDDPAR